MESLVAIRADGTLEFIYADELRLLLELGDCRITRASHVEPTQEGLWRADLSPVGGPVLEPTRLRAAALEQEQEWLETNFLKR
jgi:hypothetical protein